MNMLTQGAEGVIRAIDRLITAITRDTNTNKVPFYASMEIYSGASGSAVYTAARNLVITQVWVYATAGTAIQLEVGGRTAIQGDTNSQDYLYATIPIFLREGEDLDLTGTSANWYIVGHPRDL